MTLLAAGKQTARRDAGHGYRETRYEGTFHAHTSDLCWGGNYGAYGTPAFISLVLMNHFSTHPRLLHRETRALQLFV